MTTYNGQMSSYTSTQSENSDSNIEIKLVRVEVKSSSHPYFGQGSSKGYFIDGKESPSLTLKQNVIYRFDQSDSSNRNHRILYFTDANKTKSYQTNVNEFGIAGSIGAYTEITLSGETSAEIFYQCQNHPLMGSDLKSSTTGNDTLTSSSKNEFFDGGNGSDTSVYSWKFIDYSFKRTTNSLEVSDNRTGVNDRKDTLFNIEYIKFTDQTVKVSKVDVSKSFTGNFRDYKFFNKDNSRYEIQSLEGLIDDITGIPKLTFADKTDGISAIADIKKVFDQVTGLNTASGEMFRLYNAAFARFPDASGLQYWISKYTSGENDDRAVASPFLVSNEFKERYGDNISNSEYVETLYVNILGRDYDQSGYNYWIRQLNNGIENRGELLLGFAESKENQLLFSEVTGLYWLFNAQTIYRY